jgi:hypothetical protein
VHVGFVRNGDLPTYDGKIRKEEDLSNWMMQMDALFRANNQTSDEYKINQLPVALKGEALTWFRNCVTTGDLCLEGPLVTPWETVKDMMKSLFVPIDSVDVARSDYRVLTAPGTLEDRDVISFITKFHNLRIRIGKTDHEDMKHDFLTALRMDKRNKVKEKLQMARTSYETVDEMMKAASTFASQSHADRLAYQTTHGTSLFGNRRNFQGVSRGASTSTATDMDLSAMVGNGKRKPFRWPGVSEEEHARRGKEKLCYCCGEKHSVRECAKATQIIEKKRAEKGEKRGNGVRAPGGPRK